MDYCPGCNLMVSKFDPERLVKDDEVWHAPHYRQMVAEKIREELHENPQRPILLLRSKEVPTVR